MPLPRPGPLAFLTAAKVSTAIDAPDRTHGNGIRCWLLPTGEFANNDGLG